MMDCKNALSETGGDIIKAQEFLRTKGLASADKKASRVTAEGRIGSYIHDNRIGVLIEVNCETDFVSRGEIFKELVDDLSMQVAACPQVQYVAKEDVAEEFVRGDLEKAQEYLRKKGLSSADKKSSRIAAEGRIGSYIHDSRIGVLIERSEEFKELVNDLAMQVVACPQVQFVSVEDVPESFVLKEKELEMQREDLQSKPENIREKIVEGRISKRMGELALLEQPFIKDDKLLVKDLVKQTIATLGENIKVRRFIKFTLGEAIEDAKPQSETEA
ncbi:Polyprotein of EF-Ts, chloroplastic [Linum perenne]